MRMPVMDVRVVRVPVHDSGVHVDVGVRLARRVGRTMRVLMVRVMRMPMLVGHRLVQVLMCMILDQMKV